MMRAGHVSERLATFQMKQQLQLLHDGSNHFGPVQSLKTGRLLGSQCTGRTAPLAGSCSIPKVSRQVAVELQLCHAPSLHHVGIVVERFDDLWRVNSLSKW